MNFRISLIQFIVKINQIGNAQVLMNYISVQFVILLQTFLQLQVFLVLNYI